MPPSRSEHRLSVYARSGGIALGVTLGLVALWLGGAPVQASWPLVFGVCVAFALVLIAARRQRTRIKLPELGWILAAVVGLMLLQLVPLPLAMLDVIAPATAELRAFVLEPFGLGASGPVSLDPPATWLETARHVAYLLAFVAAAQVARAREGRRLVLGAVAVPSLVITVIVFAHLLANASSLFGFFSFEFANPPVLSPFGNPNHLAGFLTLGATATLGLALSSTERHRAWFWGLGYVATGAVVLLSLSRGGIVAFAFAQVLFGALAWSSRSSVSRAASFVWVLVAVVSVTSIGVYLAAEKLLREWETADSLEKLGESKIEFWPQFAEAVKSYPLAGMGRGAFESAYTRFQTEPGQPLFTHPENVVLQWTAELGLIPGVLLMLAGIVALVRATRRLHLGTVEAAALAGIVGVFLHDLFDFALELPPTALGTVLLLAILARPHEENVSVRPLPAGATALALLVVAAFGLVVGRDTLRSDEKLLATIIGAGATPEEVLTAARPLIQRHPADYALPGMVAGVYGASRSPEHLGTALALANRTFFLRPQDAEAHRTAARALSRAGRRTQAMLEYQLAWRAGGAGYADEALSSARTLEDLQRVVPTTAEHLHEAASRLWRAGRRDDAVALLGWGRETYSEDASLWALSAAYLNARQQGSEALAAIDRALAIEDRPEFHLTRANVLLASKRKEEATVVLEAALQKNVGHFGLSIALARQHHAAGQKAKAKEVLQRLAPFVDTPGERAQLLAFEASLHKSDGRLARALDGYLSASRIVPQHAGYRYEVARVYEQMTRPTDALREVREGARIEGQERPEIAEWIERLQQKEQQLQEIRKQRQIFGEEVLPVVP